MCLHCNGCLHVLSAVKHLSQPIVMLLVAQLIPSFVFKKCISWKCLPLEIFIYITFMKSLMQKTEFLLFFHTIYVLLKLCIWKEANVCFYFPFIIKLLIKFQRLHRYELSLLFFGIQSSPEIAYDEILTLLCIRKSSLVSNMLHNLLQERKAVFCFKHNSKKRLK